MPKMLADQNRKLVWVTDLADYHAPKVSELAAGIELQCLVTASDFQFGATDEEKITDPALCASNNSAVPGKVTREVAMNFFRWTTAAEDKAWTTFTGAGLHGYLVMRIGKPHETPFAAGDDVIVYEATSGEPMIQNPDNGSGYEKFRENFYPGDNCDERAKVAA